MLALNCGPTHASVSSNPGPIVKGDCRRSLPALIAQGSARNRCQARSPARRGRREAERLDTGEHGLRLVRSRQRVGWRTGRLSGIEERRNSPIPRRRSRPSGASDQRPGQPDRQPVRLRSAVGITGLHQISNVLHLLAKTLQPVNVRSPNRPVAGTHRAQVSSRDARTPGTAARRSSAATERALDSIGGRTSNLDFHSARPPE